MDEAVSTILSQNDEDMCWTLYFASVANSLSNAGSFEDFLKKSKTPIEQNEQELSSRQIQKQLDKADQLLSGFTPSVKEG